MQLEGRRGSLCACTTIQLDVGWGGSYDDEWHSCILKLLPPRKDEVFVPLQIFCLSQ